MMKFLEEVQVYYNNYLKSAEQLYGKLPEFCYKTTFKIVGEDDDELQLASGADLIHNCIYVNPNTLDLEWAIYHEMEHIRNATNIGHTYETGLYVKPDYNNEDYVGKCINEALTDISVEKLLQRNVNTVGYYESIAVVRQLGAVLGLSDNDLLEYYNVDGRGALEYNVNKLSGNKEFFSELDTMIDLLHKYHIQDMDKEFIEFGKIVESPLGMYESSNTKFYREIVQRKLLDLLKWGVKNGYITQDEYESRLYEFNNLCPYKNKQTQSE